jgi:hypothetical protein
LPFSSAAKPTVDMAESANANKTTLLRSFIDCLLGEFLRPEVVRDICSRTRGISKPHASDERQSNRRKIGLPGAEVAVAVV